MVIIIQVMKVILLCGSVGMHTQSLAGDRMEYIEGKGADHALMVMIMTMTMMMRRRRMEVMVMVMIKSSYQFDLNETPTVHSG